MTFYHMANGWEKILSYKNKIFIVKCSQSFVGEEVFNDIN